MARDRSAYRDRVKGRAGGARQGTAGVAYPNRTDLNRNRQPVQTASGQPYGQRQAQQSAQRAVPLPAAPPVQAPPPPAPGSLGAFNRPTEFPQEPITAGLAMGPGAGPEAIRGQPITNDDQLVAQLRGLYAAHPSTDLAALIDEASRRRPAAEDDAINPETGRPAWDDQAWRLGRRESGKVWADDESRLLPRSEYLRRMALRDGTTFTPQQIRRNRAAATGAIEPMPRVDEVSGATQIATPVRGAEGLA